MFYRLAKGIYKLVRSIRQGRNEFRNPGRPNVEEAEFEILDDDENDDDLK